MPASISRVERVPLRLILPNPLQPRREFDEDELNELALSIAEHGVLQMPTVRPGALTREGDKGFYLIAGERRIRAAKIAGFFDIEVVIQEVALLEAGVLAAVENLQRSDLNPLEEAEMILSLQATSEKTGEPLSAESLARQLGKGRGVGWIANRLDLRGMGEDVQRLVRERPDSLVHARVVDGISDSQARTLLRDFARDGGAFLPLREFERYWKDAGRRADAQTLHDLIEFYSDRAIALKRNLAPLVSRVDRLLEEAGATNTGDAPDSETATRRRTNARTGGGSVSRGRAVVGVSELESRRELQSRLSDAKAALQSALNWRRQIPQKNIAREVLEIRALLDQLSEDITSP